MTEQATGRIVQNQHEFYFGQRMITRSRKSTASVSSMRCAKSVTPAGECEEWWLHLDSN